MTPFVALITISFVVIFLASLAISYLTTSARIAGTYNRNRLLPGDINGKLRSWRKMQVLLWIGISILAVAVSAILDGYYRDVITQDGGFWFELLYRPLILLSLPFDWGLPLLYLLVGLSVFIASWIGVRLGVKLAARGFLLTCKLPIIA